ncbi:MAG: hypothetical protein ACI9BD_000039 [Candidatus Marinamargulisbacteria bacterium]
MKKTVQNAMGITPQPSPHDAGHGKKADRQLKAHFRQFVQTFEREATITRQKLLYHIGNNEQEDMSAMQGRLMMNLFASLLKYISLSGDWNKGASPEAKKVLDTYIGDLEQTDMIHQNWDSDKPGTIQLMGDAASRLFDGDMVFCFSGVKYRHGVTFVFENLDTENIVLRIFDMSDWDNGISLDAPAKHMGPYSGKNHRLINPQTYLLHLNKGQEGRDDLEALIQALMLPDLVEADDNYAALNQFRDRCNHLDDAYSFLEKQTVGLNPDLTAQRYTHDDRQLIDGQQHGYCSFERLYAPFEMYLEESDFQIFNGLYYDLVAALGKSADTELQQFLSQPQRGIGRQRYSLSADHELIIESTTG